MAVCGVCRHSTSIWLRRLTKRRSGHQHLVEAKLRCRRCGTRINSMLQVTSERGYARAADSGSHRVTKRRHTN